MSVEGVRNTPVLRTSVSSLGGKFKKMSLGQFHAYVETESLKNRNVVEIKKGDLLAKIRDQERYDPLEVLDAIKSLDLSFFEQDKEVRNRACFTLLPSLFLHRHYTVLIEFIIRCVDVYEIPYPQIRHMLAEAYLASSGLLSFHEKAVNPYLRVWLIIQQTISSLRMSQFDSFAFYQSPEFKELLTLREQMGYEMNNLYQALVAHHEYYLAQEIAQRKTLEKINNSTVRNLFGELISFFYKDFGRYAYLVSKTTFKASNAFLCPPKVGLEKFIQLIKSLDSDTLYELKNDKEIKNLRVVIELLTGDYPLLTESGLQVRRAEEALEVVNLGLKLQRSDLCVFGFNTLIRLEEFELIIQRAKLSKEVEAATFSYLRRMIKEGRWAESLTLASYIIPLDQVPLEWALYFHDLSVDLYKPTALELSQFEKSGTIYHNPLILALVQVNLCLRVIYEEKSKGLDWYVALIINSFSLSLPLRRFVMDQFLILFVSKINHEFLKLPAIETKNIYLKGLYVIDVLLNRCNGHFKTDRDSLLKWAQTFRDHPKMALLTEEEKRSVAITPEEIDALFS